MSTTTHRFTWRNGLCATALILLLCVAVSMAGCVAAPPAPATPHGPGATQPPSVVTVLVEVTRLSQETAAPTSPPPEVPTAPLALGTPDAEPLGLSASGRMEPPTPDASGQMDQPLLAPPTPDTAGQMDEPLYYEIMPCQPSNSPEVGVVRTAQVVPGEVPMLCVTGFPPNSEVTLSVTYPNGESESFKEVMAEDGTTIVVFSAKVSAPPGTYTFRAVQGDLVATASVEVEGAPETAEPSPEAPSPEPQPAPATPHGPGATEPTVEVNPVGDSGSDFEAVLSGFEPYQEVPLRLYVATDEARSEFEEIDSLTEQVDGQGEATFPLEIPPGSYPTSWYALAFFLEDGTAIYDIFEVQ
jgi:hypothetical protein